MGIYITATHGSKTYNKRVVPVETAAEFWKLLEKLCEDLSCCENLFATQPLSHVCQRCGRTNKSGRALPQGVWGGSVKAC